MNTRWMRVLFIIAGLYDGILGLAFVLFPFRVFSFFGVPPPNHEAYVQFPALLLIIFGAMFLRVACDPMRHRELILFGCALKVAYCGTVFGYEFTRGVPGMWLPWAYADFGFLVLFLVAWNRLGHAALAARDEHG